MYIQTLAQVLGYGGHSTRALVARGAVFVAFAPPGGEAARPLFGNTGGDPGSHHLFETVGTDGEELGAVVEDAVAYEVSPHTAADFLLLFEDRDAHARILEGTGSDEAGETGADDQAS